MLDLWLEASKFASEQGISLLVPKMVSPSQLYGIETEFYAHELASVVVWIGFLQWKHEHGVLEDREPILEKLGNIEHADAILRYDKDGKPYEPEWPKADYIVGNPPFLVGKRLRRELRDGYVDAMFRLYEGRVKAESDLVVYWFEKARAQLAEGRARRAGLLATQAIRGGANRNVLRRIGESGSIFWAWSDRKWLLEGAAVHVSMIGFDSGEEVILELDGGQVAVINANLTCGLDLTQALRLKQNENICYMGTTKAGAFDIDPLVARKMLKAPLNPNGRPNSDVIRPWINTLDVTRRPRGMYIIDFDSRLSESQAALYELPYQYIRQHVYPERANNRRKAYAINWWSHAEQRPELRVATAKVDRLIVTTRVSVHRVFI